MSCSSDIKLDIIFPTLYCSDFYFFLFHLDPETNDNNKKLQTLKIKIHVFWLLAITFYRQFNEFLSIVVLCILTDSKPLMWTVQPQMFNAGMLAFISFLDLQGHRDSVLHFSLLQQQKEYKYFKKKKKKKKKQ